jgi:MOSC domain-containing protein YiiM
MNALSILAVNIGTPEIIDGHRAKTGICKHPVDGDVEVHALGLAGDAVLDKKHHGGFDQAVYLYGQPDYDFIERETGRAMSPGLFGENLTIAGLESQKIDIGDRFEVGDIVFEVTSPRIPCATFAARMHDPKWVKTFFAINRPGVYVRVLKPGKIAAGMPMRHIPFAGPKVPLIELMRDYKNPAPERMRYLLQAPIHRDLAAKYHGKLAQAELPL